MHLMVELAVNTQQSNQKFEPLAWMVKMGQIPGELEAVKEVLNFRRRKSTVSMFE
jgi:hypothetical protein